ncbi:MBG domain-containing protein [uncultured Acetatifactor sp.]|uniref:MBG domain-containing protein n=1 Tax=uncultured Acetatifactor sp. TaxID=1671927 RepID=UPI0026174FF5|nr:MBG domain-containing protein [uncultured Acetatifactor sp.]
MKGRKHWWKCVLVLLLSIALVGSNVDYAMLSAYAQETDRGGSSSDRQEQEAASEEDSEYMGIRPVPLDSVEADPEEPGDAGLEEPGREDSDAVDIADAGEKDSDAADAVKADEEKPDGAGTEEPGSATSDGADSEVSGEESDAAGTEESDEGESDSADLTEPGEEKPEADDSDAADSEGAGADDSDAADTEEPGADDSDAADTEEPGKEESDGADGEKPAEEDSDAEASKEPGEESQEPDAGDVQSSEVTVVPDIDMPGNDELFAGYIEQLFYGDSGVSLFGNWGEDKLQDATEKRIYTELKENIWAVANGTRTSTIFELENISFAGVDTDSEAIERLKSAMGTIFNCLLVDCPYEFYWFDKSYKQALSYSMFTNSTGVLKVSFKFTVAEGYRGSNIYEVNSTKVVDAKRAAANAKNIVDKYANKSDYEKLEGFRKEICELVDYNNDAANTATAYGDPWQLVWVFDGKPDTKVVCEGYSKAFQYLCDLSGFDGCYTVTGVMSGGTGAGPHMWNIVTLDGNNYLVDVTNCDTGTVGAPDKLFLAGANGDVARGYTCKVGSINIVYTYDPGDKALFGEEILTLASESYQHKGKLTITAPNKVEVTFGDAVSGSVLQGGSAKNEENVDVSGTFKWDTSVTSYGEAGDRKLKVVFVPNADTGYGNVSTEVEVTVKPKQVTVEANAQTKVYGSADPKLSYKDTGVVAGYPLKGELSREPGEDVKAGGYAITQGTITNDQNPNYQITFTGNKLTITSAKCTESVERQQNVLVGVGDFLQPSYTGVKGEAVAGTITYTYNSQDNPNDQNNYSYETLKAELAKLAEEETGTIKYTFVPQGANYTGATGEITFTVKDIIFQVGNALATPSNAVTIKSGAAYGDAWQDIVTIGNLTAVAGIGKDNDQGHFSLDKTKTDIPNAGSHSFRVLYNGTVGGKTYKDEVVCEGTVNINLRVLTIAAGSYKVSKVYDKTTAAGKATGELALSNILQKDMGAVTVTATPAPYTSPDVGGQNTVKVDIELSGAASANYSPSNSTLDVPCEILPMPIAPTLEPLGSHDYTGSPITPALTVKNGDETMAASDYEAVWSNNVNAGTAKVAVKPAAGGNYTWSSTVEATFTINKIAYTGEKAKSVSVRFGGQLSLDLTSLLPEGFRLGEPAVADEEHIFETSPVLTAATLSGRLVYDKENVGKTATITIPVLETTNFHAYEFVVTVAVANKMEQVNFGFSSAVLNKVYGDGAFAVSVANAAQGSEVTFTSSNPEVAQVDQAGNVRILRAGTAVIQAQASETEEYFAASASCTLNVVPRALAWDLSGLAAVDREGAVNNGRATLYGELKVSGILDADAADVTFTCPASMLTGTYAAVNPGIQNVTLGWANPESPARLQGSKADCYMLPGTLPGFTGRINAVRNDLPAPAESTAGVRYSLTMEMGISQVPQAFQGMENLNTPAKIEAQMRLNIQSQAGDIPQERMEVYDVSLMVNVDGAGWVQAGKDNFPANGLTVTLPYPQGTGQDTNDFVVCHLFTEDMNGHRAGEAEYPAVEKTAEGIRFKVYGLSPISVGWKDAAKPDGTGNPGTGNPGNSGSAGGSQAAAGAVVSPKTSDGSHVEWYLLSMIVSGGILGGMFLWNRKRKGVK